MAVKEVPILEREVSAQPIHEPDLKEAYIANAEASNNLSAIGARIAQTASNALAQKLGYETGKNPHGDLLPSLTEFDEKFSETYHNQAQATLSLQGQKLLDDTQVQLAKAPRLTPALLAKTNAQLQLGLSKISENAPTAIKGKLEHSFASSYLDFNKNNQSKMISQQREDQTNNINESISLYQSQALEHTKNGDNKAAQAAYDNVVRLADSAVANRLKTPHEARIAKETAKQNLLNGEYINKFTQAVAENKRAEFENNLAKGPPKGMTHEQWLNVGQAVIQQDQFITRLRAEEDNFKSQNALHQIALDPGSITSQQLADLKASLTPTDYNNIEFKYLQALKKEREDGLTQDALIQNYSSPEAWANSTEKTKNKTFNNAVNYMVEKSKNTSTPLSHDMAQVQAAAYAGGEVPVFTSLMRNQLRSGNPQQIISAAQKYNALLDMGAGHALRGLQAEDKAMMINFEALSGANDPLTAAKEAINISYNQDPAVQKVNDEKFSNFIHKQTQRGTTLDQIGLQVVGLSKSDFLAPENATYYGTELLNLYGSYYKLTNGNEEGAKKLTKQFYDEKFGDTAVNGGVHKTLMPLEKLLGFKSHDAVPYIQNDVREQLQPQLDKIKQAFDSPAIPYKAGSKIYQSNEWWEFEKPQDYEKEFFRSHGNPTYEPVKIIRHMRTEKGQKSETFNVILTGNSFNQYTVGIQGKSGIRNIFQIAPFLGIMYYQPNGKKIRENYSKDHKLF